MIITYYGAGSVKVAQGETVLAFNPISKDSKEKSPRFGANIALVSLNHPDYNGVESVSYGDKNPLVIDGPGEYETGGIMISGHQSIGIGGKINTIYTVLLEGIKLCHLGAIASSELSPDVKEAIGEIDILFVPTDGGGLIEAKEAYRLATMLEPKIIIPLHRGETGKDSALAKFLKEEGKEDRMEFIDKLTLKKKDLDGKESDVVLLSSALS